MNKLFIDTFGYFGNLFDSYFNHSFFGKLQTEGKLYFRHFCFRDFQNKGEKIDDKPFGHSNGMILRADFLQKCINTVYGNNRPMFIHPSPSGKLLNEKIIGELALNENIAFINTRYEGIDARIIEFFNIVEISIGDYVLYDGDISASVIINAIARRKFVKKEALVSESLTNGLLEYRQFTHPRVFEGLEAPEVLLSGNHTAINKWKENDAIAKTMIVRPDIYGKYIKRIKDEDETKRVH